MADTADNEFLLSPTIRLFGPIGTGTFWDFMERLDQASDTKVPLVLELTTEGGDPDIARRIAMEIRLRRKRGQEVYFVGKTIVYSAGIVIMAAFPRDRRYLSEDTVLLVHERRIDTAIELRGPMVSNIQILREQLAQMETALEIEEEGFAEFAAGSSLSVDELTRKAKEALYISAKQALDWRLIEGLL